jgi:hypothetical protein
MTNTPNTYAEALDVLNARRAGVDMPESVVLKALELTGDYTPQDRYRAPFVRLFEVAQ